MHFHHAASLLLLAMAFFSSVAAAAEPAGKVTDYGILQVVTDKTTVQKLDSPAGERHEVNRVEVARQTAEIPASLDTAFGIFFTITGLPANQPVRLSKVVRYPEITNPDGKKLTSHTVPLEILSNGDGVISSFEGYKFTEHYELVPGRWTFEIWYGEKLLLSQDFSVVQP